MNISNTNLKKGKLSLKRRNGLNPESTINTSQNNNELFLKSMSGVSDLLQSCKQTTKKIEMPSPTKKIKLSQSTAMELKLPLPIVEGKNVGTNTNELKTNYCPNCQMPLAALIKQSFNWHIAECLDFDFENLKECSSGSSCISTIPSHYMKFTHYLLAETRSNTEMRNHQNTPVKLSQSFGSDCLQITVKRESFSSEDLPNIEKLDIEMNCRAENVAHTDNCIHKKCNSNRNDFYETENFHVKDKPSNVREVITKKGRNSCTREKVKNNLQSTALSAVTRSVKSLNNEQLEVNDKNNFGFGKSVHVQTDKKDYIPDDKLCETRKVSDGVPSNPNCSSDERTSNYFLNSVKLKSNKAVAQRKKSESSPQKGQTMLTSFFKPLKGENNNSKTQVEKSESPMYDEDVKTNIVRLNSQVLDEVQMPRTTQKDYTHERRNRICPFYKRIPDTTFAVDAFSYGDIPGVQNYFLSHFHYDHYNGLTRNFSHPVYCSLVTANLLVLKIKIPKKFIRVLQLNEPVIISSVEVTALDANHCPGSVMFLFRLSNGQCILHTGDFRATPKMEECQVLKNLKIEKLFLDTTYCNPRYDFPPQDHALKLITSLVSERISANSRILVACGSYTIGKEKAFMAIAERIGCKIWADKGKLNILKCLENESITSRLVTDAQMAQVHVLPMNLINIPKLQEYLSNFTHIFDEVIGVKPTGWEHASSGGIQNLCIKPICKGRVSVYGIPYSEHSSFSELRRFVQFIQPMSIIPTVNVGRPQSRELMKSLFKEWLA